MTTQEILQGVHDWTLQKVVYDVSEKNPTGGPNSDGKFTLEYILSNADTLIPTAVRKGGMSIKFVHSSDNKYIQARLMSDTFNTDVTQWQVVDSSAPSYGSHNLNESGAIAAALSSCGYYEATTSDNIAYSVNIPWFDYTHYPNRVLLVIKFPSASEAAANSYSTLSINDTTARPIAYNGYNVNLRHTFRQNEICIVFLQGSAYKAYNYEEFVKYLYITALGEDINNIPVFIKSANPINPTLNIDDERYNNYADARQFRHDEIGYDILTGSTYHRTPVYKVKPNTQYTIALSSGNASLRIQFLDNTASKYTRSIDEASATYKTFTTASNEYYLRASCLKTAELSLKEGSDTEYIAFSPVMDSNVVIPDSIFSNNEIISGLLKRTLDIETLRSKDYISAEKTWTLANEGLIDSTIIDSDTGVSRPTSGAYMASVFIPVEVGDEILGNNCWYLFKYSKAENVQSAYINKETFYHGSEANGRKTRYVITQQDYDNGVRYIRCSIRKYESPIYSAAVTKVAKGDYRMMCLGDSLFGKLIKPYDFPTFIQNIVGKKTANCGFGGTTATSRNDRYNVLSLYNLADCIATGDFSSIDIDWGNTPDKDYDFLPTVIYLKTTDYTKVDTLMIAHGTNDFSAGKQLDNTNNPKDVSTYKGALRYSIEKIQKAYPNINIVMISPFYRYYLPLVDGEIQDDCDNHTNSIGLKLIDYVDAMKEVADEYHLTFFDNLSNFGINKYNAQRYIGDGTHFNTVGGEFVGTKLGEKIKTFCL